MTDRKLRVIHIAPTPFFADRGCHIRIKNEIDSLQTKKNNNIEILLCTYHHGRDVASIATRRIWKIPGYTSLGVGFSIFKLPADLLLFFLVLWQTFRFRPNILHGHLHEGALIGWLVKTVLFWRKTVLVMDVQGSLTGELAAYGTFRKFPVILEVFTLIEKFVYLLPSHFFCSSAASRDTIISRFQVPEEKTSLLADVVADSCCITSVSRQSLGIPEDRDVVVFSGSLLEGKGIGYLQEVMSLMAKQEESPFFLLIGYPVQDMQEFVSVNKLSADCLLTGKLEYEKLLAHLALADLALEPKKAESGEASGKVLHYMAAGLPVVCFDTPNNRNILQDSGCFAANITGQGLADVLAVALRDKDSCQEKGRIGKEIVTRRFSINQCRDFLAHWYSKLSSSL